MKKRISIEEYRLIDMSLFGLMLIVFEYIIVRATNSRMFFDQAFTVSLAAPLTAIVYMRWGVRGGLEAALSGFVFCLFSGATLNQYMIYIAGNLLSLAALILPEKLGYETVRTSKWLYLVFPVLVLFLMQLGRGLVAMLLGSGYSAIIGFITTDSLDYVFTLVIIWIVHRLDGVYEDQKHYLLRVHEEMEAEKEADTWQ
ncbi:MAG: hypothetical protein Q4E57_01605 [Eubacteriales bacterium]|nr:hypothetical protein [Eubacteriales bacterium]